MSIEIKNLKKTWSAQGEADRTVLDLPSFSASEGDRVCLVGHSGCGKTTLLNIIAGIVTPTEGSVTIGSTNIVGLSESKRDLFRAQNIGYVFQTFNLLQSLSALENITVGAGFAGMAPHPAKVRAYELLDRVGLIKRAHAKPATMSVGEQQRVAIARALVNTPKIVLADEPTANLDRENGAEVLELLKETTSEENSILLVVTHDEEVRRHFDDVRKLAELCS
ncbi:MAG: putative ABC transport system ATP-binding protein [Planctomycetota bacterium]|jgi:putative ABC transport system ATP-binding protein